MIFRRADPSVIRGRRDEAGVPQPPGKIQIQVLADIDVTTPRKEMPTELAKALKEE